MTSYYIATWDTDLQAYTPQEDVPEGPYTLFSLRVPMRALREQGYPCRRGDPAVKIEAVAMELAADGGER